MKEFVTQGWQEGQMEPLKHAQHPVTHLGLIPPVAHPMGSVLGSCWNPLIDLSSAWEPAANKAEEMELSRAVFIKIPCLSVVSGFYF